ncbi:hypothetical protein M409DRAFT_49204 [Zasmidium cellare ATCC 36951]|uniref:FAS1 domain-containing protein n=1 Tax=Zasmidium cellare ATCC 36951 TaxID=1080233 RepID=A0A6A6D0E6_ZASCE|nr:uncharacterized protein M409DRAFT_49204 [Zasmidium cellare ATCC 36951]KAF2172655.1 hypothetical protein M409DRAFT_49204 [Zasmidium cellare ATCC 36951]
MRFQPLASCFFALLGEAAADSLRSVLSSRSSFSDLYNVLHFHDLLKDIDRIQNATYFAPNNDALKYLADFGINLTTADPSIARALLYYGLIDGQHSVESILQDDDIQLVQSALHPPLFTNVTDGQALKLRTKRNGEHSTVVLETGLQVLTKLVETDIRFDHGVLHGTSTNMVLPHNISETLNLGNLHEFLRLVKVTDLVPELESLADVTFLFPHDKAIQKLRPVLDILSPIQLAAFVRNHAIPNHVLYGKVIGSANKTLQTVAGGSATIRRYGKGQAYVNDIPIVREDILIYGGVAHIVDDVLFPDPREFPH